MLHMILGRSGSGKSRVIQKQMEEALRSGKSVFFLVPEQFSFESEGNLASALCGPDFFRLQLVSFTRLATRIFEAGGGPAPRFLDKGGKALLAAKAAMTAADTLQVFQRSALSVGFTNHLMAFFDEAAACAVSPLALEAAAAHLPESSRLRLSDLSTLYAVYTQLVSSGPLDPADCLLRAAETAERIGFFAGSVWFLDGFDRFSTAQKQLLAVLLRQAESVTVALTAEGLSDTGNGFGVFSQSHDTIRALQTLAKENGVPIAAPLLLRENHRAENRALAALEEGFLAPEKQESVSCGDALRVFSCENVFEEAEVICGLISALVQNAHYRYRDMVIITRNLRENEDIFAQTFAKYKIPLFLDQRVPIAGKPLPVFLSALLDVLQYGFRTEDVLRFAKAGGLGLSPHALAQLENYCYVWRIDRGRWKKDFLFHPAGMAGAMTDDDRAVLKEINQTRLAVVTPVLRFAEQLADANGRDFAAALWSFIEETGCQKQLDDNTDLLPEEQAKEAKEEGHRIYNRVAALLDQFVANFGETQMDVPTFSRLFTLQLAQYTLGEVPNTLDSVLLGSAERIRADNRKVCFVSGFVHGAWPIEGTGDSLISTKDRRALLEENIDLGGLEEAMAAREDFTCYAALTAPRQKLLITVPAADRRYAPLLPSRYLKSILSLYTDLSVTPSSDLPDTFGIVTDRVLSSAAAAGYRKRDQKEAALLHVLDSRHPGAAAALAKAAKPKHWALTDKAAAKTLFGSPVSLSPSRAERFFGCHFSYFLEYAMRLKERKRAVIDPIKTGDLIHHVLEQAIRSFGPEQLAKAEDAALRAFCKAEVLTFAKETLSDPALLTPRQKAQLTRIAGTLTLILRRLGLEFAQSEFTPADFELPVGDEEAGLPAYVLKTPAGNRVRVTGRIDRVDVLNKNGSRYIRVVDYKSGHKDFALRDVFYGINLQMLFYLFAIWKNGAHRYGETLPAGILYFPAKAAWGDREDDEKDDEALCRQFPIQGLLLEEPAVLEAMDASCKGLFIPSARGKKGSWTKTDSLATLSQLGNLMLHVDNALQKMADDLLAGQIDALPRRTEASCRCDYCSYQAICQNEMAARSLQMDDLNKTEFYTLLAEEKEGAPLKKSAEDGEVLSPWA